MNETHMDAAKVTAKDILALARDMAKLWMRSEGITLAHAPRSEIDRLTLNLLHNMVNAEIVVLEDCIKSGTKRIPYRTRLFEANSNTNEFVVQWRVAEGEFKGEWLDYDGLENGIPKPTTQAEAEALYTSWQASVPEVVELRIISRSINVIQQGSSKQDF